MYPGHLNDGDVPMSYEQLMESLVPEEPSGEEWTWGDGRVEGCRPVVLSCDKHNQLRNVKTQIILSPKSQSTNFKTKTCVAVRIPTCTYYIKWCAWIKDMWLLQLTKTKAKFFGSKWGLSNYRLTACNFSFSWDQLAFNDTYCCKTANELRVSSKL